MLPEAACANPELVPAAMIVAARILLSHFMVETPIRLRVRGENSQMIERGDTRYRQASVAAISKCNHDAQ